MCSPPVSIRCSISRRSAGRRGAIRTPSSIPRDTLRPMPTFAAAGVNPFEHFHQFGWSEGRLSSPSFDARQYLAHYADVAACGRGSARALPHLRHL
jgi:hypothetical protein